MAQLSKERISAERLVQSFGVSTLFSPTNARASKCTTSCFSLAESNATISLRGTALVWAYCSPMKQQRMRVMAPQLIGMIHSSQWLFPSTAHSILSHANPCLIKANMNQYAHTHAIICGQGRIEHLFKGESVFLKVTSPTTSHPSRTTFIFLIYHNKGKNCSCLLIKTLSLRSLIYHSNQPRN